MMNNKGYLKYMVDCYILDIKLEILYNDDYSYLINDLKILNKLYYLPENTYNN